MVDFTSFGGMDFGGFGESATSGLPSAAVTDNRSALLRALEQAYHAANQDALSSATANAQRAGTYANTPEFLAGLQSEAQLQGQGAQAAMLPRIAALRSAEGLSEFNPALTTQGDYQYNPWSELISSGTFSPSAPTYADTASATRAALLRELEAAYGGAAGDVAQSFVGSSDQAQLGNADYLRGIQSNVQSGITGAENVMQARINALRSAQNLEAFSDPQTAGQQANQAQQVTQSAAQNITNPQTVVGGAAGSTSRGIDIAAENVDDSEGGAETASQQNAVTAAATKKKAAPKVL